METTAVRYRMRCLAAVADHVILVEADTDDKGAWVYMRHDDWIALGEPDRLTIEVTL